MIVGHAGATVNERVAVHEFASVAVTVKVRLVVDVGVPVSAPFAASERPVGSTPVVKANVYGAMPPLAVMVWL